jgi:hypothetical protein
LERGGDKLRETIFPSNVTWIEITAYCPSN